MHHPIGGPHLRRDLLKHLRIMIDYHHNLDGLKSLATHRTDGSDKLSPAAQ